MCYASEIPSSNADTFVGILVSMDSWRGNGFPWSKLLVLDWKLLEIGIRSVTTRFRIFWFILNLVTGILAILIAW